MREKVGKSRNTAFFQWFVAPEGRKVGSLKRRVRSQLARWEMKNCTPLWREAHFQVKMCRTPQRRTTFGSWDVEKVHAVVARSTFPSQNAQNTSASDDFWKLRCRKSARRCGAKHISKSKCTKHTMYGPFLEVQMSKKCTLLWREAHFQVKMLKTQGVRTTFGGSDAASLRFTTLHYTKLHSTTLHYITLHYTPQHYNYNYTPLHSTTLNYTTLHYTTLHSITLHYTALHYTTLHYTTFHYTSLHYTTLHYTTTTTTTTLHYTPLHYTTLHYTTLRRLCFQTVPVKDAGAVAWPQRKCRGRPGDFASLAARGLRCNSICCCWKVLAACFPASGFVWARATFCQDFKGFRMEPLPGSPRNFTRRWPSVRHVSP